MKATLNLYRQVSATLLMISLIWMLPSTTQAHLAMIYPPCRGSPLDKLNYDGKVHCFIGFEKERTLPCNGYNSPGPVTALRAGQQVDVRFWGPAMNHHQDLVRLPPRPGMGRGGFELNQARHGGGTCQFSLSYDGGKTFHLIGKYNRSCPDFYYSWPVKIPDNVPSCTEPGQCLFVWSWTAHFIDQYYQNCADVTIEGQTPGQLPKKGIQVVNVVDKGYMNGFTAAGDEAGDKMGKGPNMKDYLMNMKGLWN